MSAGHVAAPPELRHVLGERRRDAEIEQREVPGDRHEKYVQAVRFLPDGPHDEREENERHEDRHPPTEGKGADVAEHAVGARRRRARLRQLQAEMTLLNAVLIARVSPGAATRQAPTGECGTAKSRAT